MSANVKSKMCPHCGVCFSHAECAAADIPGMIPFHDSPSTLFEYRQCPGSLQGPRNAEADRRQLWNGDYPDSTGATP